MHLRIYLPVSRVPSVEWNMSLILVYQSLSLIVSSERKRNAQSYEVLEIFRIENEFITSLGGRFLSLLMKSFDKSPKNITQAIWLRAIFRQKVRIS